MDSSPNRSPSMSQKRTLTDLGGRSTYLEQESTFNQAAKRQRGMQQESYQLLLAASEEHHESHRVTQDRHGVPQSGAQAAEEQAKQAAPNQQHTLSRIEAAIHRKEYQLAEEDDSARHNELHQEIRQLKQSRLQVFLLDHNTYAPIFDTILDNLQIQHILTLTRVNKTFYALYTDRMTREWNVDKRLSRFVSQPEEFRYQLGLNNGLIFGSFPMQVFSRLYRKDASLDILVEGGVSARAIEEYLLGEGYHKISTSRLRPMYELQDRVMTDWHRGIGDNAVHVKVIAVTDQSTPALMPSIYLKHFMPSTASACFITCDAAYCLFPRYDFIDQKFSYFYEAFDQDDEHEAAMQRHDQRGFGSLDMLAREVMDQEPMHQPRITDPNREWSAPITRRFGDPDTWTIPLNLRSSPDLKLKRTYMQNCTYGVCIAASFFDPNICGADIHVDRYESCVLRKTYAYDDQEATEISWHRMARSRCRGLKLRDRCRS